MKYCKVFTRLSGLPPSVRLLFAFVFFTVIILTSCATKKDPVPDPVTVEVPPEIPPEPLEPLIEMVSIPGGIFSMGSPRARAIQDNEYPVQSVTLRGFLLGKYEVTQGEYFEITGLRPSQHTVNPEDNSEDGWKNLPVERVNWYETLVFCNKLSVKERLNPVYRIRGSTDPEAWGTVPSADNKVNKEVWDKAEMVGGANGYRLPTEAEWEYAARGGASSKNFTFAGSNTVNDVAWWYENSRISVNTNHIPHEVGKKPPNELGLYDMSGNVMEWCWDWYGDYKNESQSDPAGPLTSPHTAQPVRIIRGGSFSYGRDYCRVTYRHRNEPFHSEFINLGFRVARWE